MKIYIKTAGITIENPLIEGNTKKYIFTNSDKLTIENVISLLEIKKQGAITYMLNGNNAKDDTQLKDEDELLFMRMMYGG